MSNLLTPYSSSTPYPSTPSLPRVIPSLHAYLLNNHPFFQTQKPATQHPPLLPASLLKLQKKIQQWRQVQHASHVAQSCQLLLLNIQLHLLLQSPFLHHSPPGYASSSYLFNFLLLLFMIFVSKMVLYRFLIYKRLILKWYFTILFIEFEINLIFRRIVAGYAKIIPQGFKDTEFITCNQM